MIVTVLLLAIFVWILWWAIHSSTRRPREPANPARTAATEALGPTSRSVVRAPNLTNLPPDIIRLIEGLPRRSMDELQQQWLNTVRMIDRLGPEKARPQIAFRDALTHEWANRSREAARNPTQFAWPSTKAAPGSGNLKGSDWHVIGMLSYLGYRVGAAQGEKAGVRRQILDVCFAADLPPINGMAYLEEWGAPATAARLKKLAHELASFIRNAKRKRSANLAIAIDDWEEDLSYLYGRYYVQHFRFVWPRLDLR